MEAAAAEQQETRGGREEQPAPLPPPPPPHQQEAAERQAQLRRPEEAESASHYVQCGGSTEEYNRQAYGATEYHRPVGNSRGAGATDGPTLSGGALAQTFKREP